MPRQERTKSGTGIYHVMLRGINKQDMFEDDEDYLQMTSIKTKMITEPSLGHQEYYDLRPEWCSPVRAQEGYQHNKW